MNEVKVLLRPLTQDSHSMSILFKGNSLKANGPIVSKIHAESPGAEGTKKVQTVVVT